MVGQIIRGLSFEDYCKLPGINASILKEVDKETLLHAQATMEGHRERTSDALDFGHSFHELLLRDAEDFAVHPATYPAPAKHPKVKAGEIADGDPLPWNWGANVCKEWALQHEGQIIHSQEEASNLRGMVAAVRARKDLQPYLNGDTEVAVTGSRNGRPMKGLIDLLPSAPGSPVIDFKKVRSASPRLFVSDALKLGYHLQSAIYLDLLRQAGDERRQFWFVPVEDKPPYAVSVVKFNDIPGSLLRVGRTRYRGAFDRLVAAAKAGEWPGYGQYDAEEFAPAWLIPELENTL